MPPVRPTTENSSPALAPAVFRGSSWAAMGAVFSRGVGLAAQIVLGLLLSDHDFGVYAIAIGVSSVLTVLRDGGARQLLISRPKEHAQLLAPVFWIAVAFALGTGALLALTAPLAAGADSDVATLLLIIALVQPLSVPGSILSARLQIDLRFGALTAIQSTLALVRFGGAVLLAWRGFGPLSFVLPLIPMAFIEWAWAWALTRDHPWFSGPRLRQWRGLLRVSAWAVIGSAGIAAINSGVPVVLGVLVPSGVVGVYFFAQQLVTQIGIVLGASLAQVLFPAFTRLLAEPERKRRATLRALRQSMLLASPMCAAMAAIIIPFESLVWGGKWAQAAHAVIVMALVYPINVASAIPVAVQQSRSDFRAWGLGVNVVALVTFAGAGIAAALSPDPLPIAAASSVAMALASILYTAWALRPLSIGLRDVLGAIAPAWAMASIAAGLALVADAWFMTHWPALVRCLLGGAIFTLGFAALVRLVVVDQVIESVNMLPSPLRRVANGLLRLRSGIAAPAADRGPSGP